MNQGLRRIQVPAAFPSAADFSRGGRIFVSVIDRVIMEFLDLPQLISASGSVRLPGSKSISNRVLLLAALAEGETEVRDLLASDDTERMLDALKTLGVGVTHQGGEHWLIKGCAGQIPVKQAELFLGNAGTAFRPLTAALGAGGRRLHPERCRPDA